MLLNQQDRHDNQQWVYIYIFFMTLKYYTTAIKNSF